MFFRRTECCIFVHNTMLTWIKKMDDIMEVQIYQTLADVDVYLIRCREGKGSVHVVGRYKATTLCGFLQGHCFSHKLCYKPPSIVMIEKHSFHFEVKPHIISHFNLIQHTVMVCYTQQCQTSTRSLIQQFL